MLCQKVLFIQTLVIGTIFTFVVVSAQFELDFARQHVHAFLLEVWFIPHDLSPVTIALGHGDHEHSGSFLLACRFHTQPP